MSSPKRLRPIEWINSMTQMRERWTRPRYRDFMIWVIQICDPSRPNSWFMDVDFIVEIAHEEWEEACQDDERQKRTLNIELTTQFWTLVLAGNHPDSSHPTRQVVNAVGHLFAGGHNTKWLTKQIHGQWDEFIVWNSPDDDDDPDDLEGRGVAAQGTAT